jgi:hypothetical protein
VLAYFDGRGVSGEPPSFLLIFSALNNFANSRNLNKTRRDN